MERTTNFAALGEFTAYQQQARDAAGRRFALLKNLAAKAGSAADREEEALDGAGMVAAVEEIRQVDREMHAALARANQAGALCGQPELRLGRLLGKW